MRGLKIILLAFLIVSILPGVSSAMKMNIDPARAEVVVKPGDEKTGVVTVLNYDEESPMHVKAYVQDLVYLPDGSNDFLPLGSTPWSLGDFIKIGPTEFDIPPGRQEQVRYVISLPKDAKGGRYGVIFFETATPPSDFKQVGATVNVRLGTILLVTAEGSEIIKAKLTGMSVNPRTEKDKPMEISWTVYNDSNILIRPFGTVKIIDDKKTEVATVDVNKEKAGILPKTNRKFSIQYEDKAKLPKGDYYVQLVLDYGGEALLGAQSSFKIE
ncbi:MAG: hypothetical protein HZA30_04885 [Candidatus Omnitrophica bacterium]|nr:hypothetical protein [Candidatus Omnitrophota bacterium]